MSAFATVTRNFLLENQFFTLIFAFKLFFHVSIDVANNKYYMKFLIKYFYQKLEKFDQNRMIVTAQNFDLFDKNLDVMLMIC